MAPWQTQPFPLLFTAFLILAGAPLFMHKQTNKQLTVLHGGRDPGNTAWPIFLRGIIYILYHQPLITFGFLTTSLISHFQPNA